MNSERALTKDFGRRSRTRFSSAPSRRRRHSRSNRSLSPQPAVAAAAATVEPAFTLQGNEHVYTRHATWSSLPRSGGFAVVRLKWYPAGTLTVRKISQRPGNLRTPIFTDEKAAAAYQLETALREPAYLVRIWPLTYHTDGSVQVAADLVTNRSLLGRAAGSASLMTENTPWMLKTAALLSETDREYVLAPEDLLLTAYRAAKVRYQPEHDRLEAMRKAATQRHMPK